ncbi:MAG TPA: hypothetical protein VK097_10025 [Lentibacillus sp.]|uniref:hypothetical protein n=1 Tax=Lentibacillus sp. TaxID=1925746 RepID=UPI002B4B1E50|nr:hypothetical protein [Lentibacillus sp.]HLR62764.1 hypothetical protein [Lentibacillus sp.]
MKRTRYSKEFKVQAVKEAMETGKPSVVGFGIGVAGSVAFDFVYDNKEKIGEAIGDAVSGLFDGLGSCFG